MPDPVSAPPESLAEAFRAVARQLRQQTQTALAPWDLTPAQARALGTLVRHGRMRVGTLAEHLRIAPRSATEVVDDLGVAGLIVRSPDPADRRAVLVEPSHQGKKVAASIRADRTAEADDFFARLDDADRAALAEILRKLRV